MNPRCGDCQGTGWVVGWHTMPDGSATKTEDWVPCPCNPSRDCHTCDGRGWVMVGIHTLTKDGEVDHDVDQEPCPTCDGGGRWSTPGEDLANPFDLPNP